MHGVVTALYNYPVKGLSPQALPSVELTEGRGFPIDRIFALARHNSGCDPAQFRPLPKTRFHMLARDADLARLRSEYDPASGRLTLTLEGETVLAADLGNEDGAAETAAFIARFLGVPQEEAPYVAAAGNNRFTDVSVRSAEMMHAVSLINLASVGDLEARIGQPVDPLRFRANILFDGWPAWAELSAEGADIEIGDITLRPCLRTKRCPATQVDPETGARDLDIPALLAEQYGHSDMGIYAEVIRGGRLDPGAAIVLR